MPSLKVTFNRIDVQKDGDGRFEGKGDFYYDMVVGDTKIISVGREQNIGASDGEKILMNASTDVTVPDSGPGASLRVSGWVSEADGGLAGSDDRVGTFDHLYTPANGWGIGHHSVKMTRKAKVVVHYKIDPL